MAVTLNANTSTGFIATSDTSGVLQLQTAGTTAVSISAAQVVTLTNALPVASGGSGVTTSTGTGANVLGTTPSFTSTIGVGGATASASGSGISFPATQSASSDVNTLDDYEEGTYTATMTCSTSGTITLASGGNTLSYTKIGRQVTVNGYLGASAISSPTGAIYINLPFAALNSLTTQTCAVVVPNTLASGNILNYWSYVSSVNSRIEIYLGGSTSVNASSAQTVSASSDFRVLATYFTA